MTSVSIVSAASLPHLHRAAYSLFCTHRHKPWQLKTFVKSLLMPNSVIAVVNNQLAGYVLVSEVLGELEVEDLCVLSTLRQQGIALEMFLTIITRAENINADYIFLEVAKSNTKARSLYERLGFDILSIRKDYYSLAGGQLDDAVLMRKDIAK